MAIAAQVNGTWIDVDTYVVIGDTGRITQTIDAGHFLVNDYMPQGNLGYLDGVNFSHAIIDFSQLANQDFNIGDTVLLNGAIEGDYVTSAATFAQNQKRIKNARVNLAKALNTWGKHNLKGNKLQAYNQQTDKLVDGSLTVNSWHKAMPLLLFGDRSPSAKYLRLQDQLKPLEVALNAVITHASEYTLIFGDPTTLSGQATGQTPTAPGEVHLQIETIHANVPMRENYKAEWQKYRQQTQVYRNQHPE